MRAFLSHSSTDKGLVENVAERLGRAKVFYDVYSIAGADDIVTALESGLAKCDVFALFVSKKSLASTWVNLEMSIAQRRAILGDISKLCIFLIDEEVTEADLPAFFRSVHIRREKSPRVIADEIVRNMQLVISSRQQSFFVGRLAEITEAQNFFVSTDNPDPPIVVMFGLEGIGRRTFTLQLARNLFSLQSRLDVPCKAGDGPAEILLELETELALLPDGVDVQSRYVELSAKCLTDLVDSLREILEAATAKGVLVTLIDRGGLLNEEGQLHGWCTDLNELLTKSNRAKAAIISMQNPRYDYTVDSIPIPALRINALPANDIAVLLKRLFARYNIDATTDQVRRLSEHVNGYPPAAYFAARMAAQDGVGMLLNNVQSIQRLTEGRFIRLLEQDKLITESMKQSLSLLSYYSPLPLPIIADFCQLDPPGAHETLKHLLDCALIYPDGGSYSISEPIRNAVSRLYHSLSVDHARAAHAISKYLDEFDDSEMRFSLGRSLYRAELLSGEAASGKAIALISEAIEVAISYYHDHEYEKVLTLGHATLQVQPNVRALREYYVRSLLQLDRIDEADAEIRVLERQGSQKDAAFLKGFAARKRQDHKQAVIHYNRAIELGRRGTSVRRELAHSYFLLGNLSAAREEIRAADERDPDNPYIADLKCQIETKLGNEREAYQALNQLRGLDKEEFYWHRKAAVDTAFGRRSDALDAARRSCALNQRPSFAQLTQLISSLIDNHRFDEAKKVIEDVDSRFRGQRTDVRIGLRCKLYNALGDYQSALTAWDQLKVKGNPVASSLRAQSLLLKRQSEPLTSGEEAFLVSKGISPSDLETTVIIDPDADD